jgi:hypothetical protein
VEGLAARIVSLLRYRALSAELEEAGRAEARQLDWDWVAARTEAVYREVVHA